LGDDLTESDQTVAHKPQKICPFLIDRWRRLLFSVSVTGGKIADGSMGRTAMLRESVCVIALALAATLVPTVVKADDITYGVDETVGIGQVTGSITTNGTIGTLVTADIVDWNVLLNDGTNPPVRLEGPASGNNSLVFLDGDLSATATQLLFAFGAADGGRLQFYVIGGPVVCWSTIVDCTGTPVGVSLSTLTPFGQPVYTALSDTEAIGSVSTSSTVPEPGTVALLLAGIPLMGMVRKRRIRTV
jgi:hypothetical protein